MNAIALVLACLAAADVPASPFTYVFDTVARSAAPWDAAAVAARRGWAALEEDELVHEFRGDVALGNDKLVLVLRRSSSGAEIYARTAAGWKPRGSVAPLAAPGAKPGSLAAVKILENSPGAVMAQGQFAAPGGAPCVLAFRLTTGQSIVELRPGDGAKAVALAAAADWAVVPDFFGDDAVLGAAAGTRPRVGVPAENFFLTLSDQGSAMLMCVWPTPEQRADVLFAPGARPSITGVEITAAKKADQPIWLAFLQAPGLWHEGARAGDPPFPARWRTDVVRGPGLARSADREEAGRSEPGLGATALTYPIDRNRDTPLATFCPIDVLRTTLGVGPCQYILQTEGLASDANPTPDNVMNWVEEQFTKRREKRSRDEIRALLEQMTEHVGQAQARVARYAAAVEEIGRLAPAEPLGPTIEYLRRALAGADAKAQAGASDLSAQVIALIGRPGAAEECQRLGREIRRLGAVQDAALARARMGLRWLREQARQADEPWSAKVESRVNEALK